MREIKLMTRKEIMDCWNTPITFNHLLCCPDCRDILTKFEDDLVCLNHKCLNVSRYHHKNKQVFVVADRSEQIIRGKGFEKFYKE